MSPIRSEGVEIGASITNLFFSTCFQRFPPEGGGAQSEEEPLFRFDLTLV